LTAGDLRHLDWGWRGEGVFEVFSFQGWSLPSIEVLGGWLLIEVLDAAILKTDCANHTPVSVEKVKVGPWSEKPACKCEVTLLLK